MSIQCGGQSLWKYIIDISLDVNTQKCRQRDNKICVPFWCSSWFDNYKGKIISQEITTSHMIRRAEAPTSQMIVFHKNGLLGLSGCLEQPKGLHCWDIKGLSLPDESIKIGLQKSAQISVHKCVQKLAYKSTKIGLQNRKSGRVYGFKKQLFQGLSSRQKSFCQP